MAYPRPFDVDLSMGTVPEGRGTQLHGINNMLVCTYDESHLVSGGRYFSHIEECRKAYLERGEPGKMMQCPFRSSHHVAAQVMDKHIQLCDGYYEWQMLNQEDPPSMKTDDETCSVETSTTVDEKESVKDAEGAIGGSVQDDKIDKQSRSRTDSYHSVNVASGEDTAESFVSASDFYSDTDEH
ncbi:unnamed protein product [Orchesella dallaii]|uniref:CHHC U11-48K-type domain-containing protein n=1 Tax=Orchesella dallaii TaxID=48710 RepID=A0ABP1QWJ5_9HEXA